MDMRQNSKQSLFWAITFVECSLAFLVLVACSTTQALPTVTPQPSKSVGKVFTDTVESPDGSLALLLECAQVGIDVSHCKATLPTGEYINGEHFEWLPNNRYVIVTSGCTHDSPCTGRTIWDAVEGKLLGSFQLWYQLSPDRTTMVYITPDVHLNVAPHLMLLDLATGRETELTTCPDWINIPDGMPLVCSSTPGSPPFTPTPVSFSIYSYPHFT
jgi:hypothetical protein